MIITVAPQEVVDLTPLVGLVAGERVYVEFENVYANGGDIRIAQTASTLTRDNIVDQGVTLVPNYASPLCVRAVEFKSGFNIGVTNLTSNDVKLILYKETV